MFYGLNGLHVLGAQPWLCRAKQTTLKIFPDTGGFSEEAEHVPSSPDLGSGQILGAVSVLSQKPLRGHQHPWPLEMPFHCSDFFWASFQHSLPWPLQPPALHLLSRVVFCWRSDVVSFSKGWTPLGYRRISNFFPDIGSPMDYSTMAHMPSVITYISNTGTFCYLCPF